MTTAGSRSSPARSSPSGSGLMPAAYHVPVMVAEVLEYMKPERGGLYFDGTLGGGGHTRSILQRGEHARMISVDRDEEAIVAAEARLAEFSDRLVVRCRDYASAAEELSEPLAGALLDLGISSRQVDRDERGFSFREDVPLDMRMSGPDSGEPSAADLLNRLPEADLADVFYHFGEERRARPLAREVVRRRGTRPFESSDDLVGAMRAVLGPTMDASDKARIFQALRIAVNRELEQLDRGLEALRSALEPGGVLVALSYHSLEDRRVKRAFREWSRACVCPPELPVCRCRGRPLGETLTRRPRYPTESEIDSNPRARSARLRAWRKAA